MSNEKAVVYGWCIRNKVDPRRSPKKVWIKIGHLRAHITRNSSDYYPHLDDYEVIALAGGGVPMIEYIHPEKVINVLRGK
jgi:hypothetical protein